MTTPANTITLPARDARRIADLLDYLSDMAEHAEDHLDDADERRELLDERLSARYWANELRRAAPLTCPPPLP